MNHNKQKRIPTSRNPFFIILSTYFSALPFGKGIKKEVLCKLKKKKQI